MTSAELIKDRVSLYSFSIVFSGINFNQVTAYDA